MESVGPSQRRLVGAHLAQRQAQLSGDLLNQGRFAHLAWTGDYLYEVAWLGEPFRDDRALVGGFLFTHDAEYFYSVY